MAQPGKLSRYKLCYSIDQLLSFVSAVGLNIYIEWLNRSIDASLCIQEVEIEQGSVNEAGVVWKRRTGTLCHVRFLRKISIQWYNFHKTTIDNIVIQYIQAWYKRCGQINDVGLRTVKPHETCYGTLMEITKCSQQQLIWTTLCHHLEIKSSRMLLLSPCQSSYSQTVAILLNKHSQIKLLSCQSCICMFVVWILCVQCLFPSCAKQRQGLESFSYCCCKFFSESSGSLKQHQLYLQ